MKLMKFVVLFIIVRLIQARVVSAQEDTLFTCFETNEELKAAVDAYVLDPSNATSEVALQYGWPIGNWCTDRVTNFIEVFRPFRRENLLTFNEDISGWNTSSATTMNSMFFDADSFNQPLDGWDVSKVLDMSWMFSDADSFNQPLVGWDVSNVQYMIGMFFSAGSFNQPLNGWDVSNVRYMARIFYLAESFNQPLKDWDVSKVQDMSYMFYGAYSFDQPLIGWDVSNVQDVERMFSYAYAFNQPLSGWDVSKVQDISQYISGFSGMFEGASSFDQNLCAWGTTIRSAAWTNSMFLGSGCPLQEDPDLTWLLIIPRRVPSPLCYRCCRTFELLCKLRSPT